ncbi:MAG: DUF928 domain-containing protein [Spirulinaceae cyanobacterium]
MNLRQSILFLGIILGCFAPVSSVAASILSSNLSQTTSTGEIALKFPSGDERRGSPNRTAGAGRRSGVPSGGLCVDTSKPRLTVLMPKNNVGTTIAPNPNMFWFVPETTAEEAEFVIVNQDVSQEVYFATFELPEGENIVKLELPEELELKKGTNYSWSLALVCDFQDRSKDEVVRGLLERQELAESLEVEREESFKKVEFYANARAWNETLLSILSLREEYPQKWREFLTSVELADLSEFPVVEIEEVTEESIATEN